MAEARQRLSRLIELASESTPEKQRALAFELCELLTDWPTRYPPDMREPFEALMEKVLRRLDGTSRRLIASRVAGHPATDLALLNGIYFDAGAEGRAAILARNAASGAACVQAPLATDEASLIELARVNHGHAFAESFANFIRVPKSIAGRIIDDESADALAVACKGAHLGRTTFSALALLTANDARINPDARLLRLSAFDRIPADGANALLAHWQRTRDESVSAQAGAGAA